MDGIEIRVTGATPLEVLARLGAFGMHCLANPDVCEAAKRIFDAEAVKEKAAAQQVEAPSAPAPSMAAPDPAKPAVVPTYMPAPTPGPMVVPMTAPTAQNAPVPPAGAPASPAAAAMPVMQASVTAPTPSPSALSGQMAIAFPSEAPVAVAPTAAPSYSLDEITRAGADFIVRNPDKQDMLNSLFPQFGITTLADLRPEQMGAFATAMRAMGVTI